MSANLPPLFHYAGAPVTSVYSVAQSDGRFTMKPSGLWLSAEDPSLDDPMSWREWCAAEQFGIGEVRHRVTLAPGANILHLATPEDIDDLGARFPNEAGRELTSLYAIEWRAVAKRYQGIVIAPYQWERRLDDKAAWYYPWDCASGCVWDAAAIASIEPVEVLEVHT